MMNLIITIGKKTQKTVEENNVLARANVILVQIVKYEWNTTWKDFIPQICKASVSDQNLCENNLSILKILSEEVMQEVRFLTIPKTTSRVPRSRN
jgi:exportin-1